MSTDPSSHDSMHTTTPEESTAQNEPDQFETTHGFVDSCSCLECGTSVPSQVGRVYGDNDDCVKACRHCWEDSQGNKTASTHAAAAMHAITEGRL